MGLPPALASDATMGSLPLAKAGVGAAMNDAARLVGGAVPKTMVPGETMR